MVDLNAFVPPGSQATLGEPIMINDRGEIWGQAILGNGNNSAFLLIPCEDARTPGCTEGVARRPTPIRNAHLPGMSNAQIQVRSARARLLAMSLFRARLARRFHLPAFTQVNASRW